MQKKFYFMPLKRGKQLKEKKEEILYCKVQKPGVVVFLKSALIELGISLDLGIFYRLYVDQEKRAVAIKFYEKINKGFIDKDVHFLKPYKTKQGSYIANISIKSFLSTLDNVSLPTPRLDINIYKDTDEFSTVGEVYYFIIPKMSENKNSDIKE